MRRKRTMADELYVEIGERLRKQRKKMGLTQEEVAELLGDVYDVLWGDRTRQPQADDIAGAGSIRKNEP